MVKDNRGNVTFNGISLRNTFLRVVDLIRTDKLNDIEVTEIEGKNYDRREKKYTIRVPTKELGDIIFSIAPYFSYRDDSNMVVGGKNPPNIRIGPEKHYDIWAVIPFDHKEWYTNSDTVEVKNAYSYLRNRDYPRGRKKKGLEKKKMFSLQELIIN